MANKHIHNGNASALLSVLTIVSCITLMRHAYVQVHTFPYAKCILVHVCSSLSGQRVLLLQITSVSHKNVDCHLN